MKNGSPEISVVIIAFNGIEFIDDCLSTTYESLKELISEVIVVDNGSNDGTPELITDNYPDTILIRNNTNLGFARAVNQGFQQAGGEYVLLLNQDIRIKSKAIPRLLKNLFWCAHSSP